MYWSDDFGLKSMGKCLIMIVGNYVVDDFIWMLWMDEKSRMRLNFFSYFGGW